MSSHFSFNTVVADRVLLQSVGFWFSLCLFSFRSSQKLLIFTLLLLLLFFSEISKKVCSCFKRTREKCGFLSLSFLMMLCSLFCFPIILITIVPKKTLLLKGMSSREILEDSGAFKRWSLTRDLRSLKV